MEIVHEDNHLLVVRKEAGEIVQGDKTGDTPMVDHLKQYLKEKYNKPGNVFCGVVHRIDRPVAGLVLFARTSKALTRLNDMLRQGEIHKTYWALVEGRPKEAEGELEDWLLSDSRLNKTRVVAPGTEGAKLSRLRYRTVATGDRYTLLEIELLTGRKHQIRVQLASRGNSIKGDLKYGARRSNPNGGISLLARNIKFRHPVSKEELSFTTDPLPEMQKLLQ